MLVHHDYKLVNLTEKRENVNDNLWKILISKNHSFSVSKLLKTNCL